MAKAIDLTGQKFGYLTVLERDFEIQKLHPNERQAWWRCKCEACGKEKSLRASVIKKAKSCGCISKGASLNTKLTEEHKKKISEGIKNSETYKKAMKKQGERKRENLVGQRFSRLIVLEYAEEEKQVYYNGKHKSTWKCKCDCGNIHYATSENLKRGDTPSCGCITKENQRAKLKDLTGQKFGHLTVLKWLGTINGNSKYWVKCDCGKEYEIYASNLIQGNTTSCGCVKESHGEIKIREILKQNDIKFINQKSFSEFRYPDTNGIPKYDFFLPYANILIEYDGEQHFKPVFSWDTEETFLLRQKHDKLKNEYALNNNFILIRIPYTHYNKITIEDLLENSKFKVKGETKNVE